jgi:hypothetical protein
MPKRAIAAQRSNASHIPLARIHQKLPSCVGFRAPLDVCSRSERASAEVSGRPCLRCSPGPPQDRRGIRQRQVLKMPRLGPDRASCWPLSGPVFRPSPGTCRPALACCPLVPGSPNPSLARAGSITSALGAAFRPAPVVVGFGRDLFRTHDEPVAGTTPYSDSSASSRHARQSARTFDPGSNPHYDHRRVAWHSRKTKGASTGDEAPLSFREQPVRPALLRW